MTDLATRQRSDFVQPGLLAYIDCVPPVRLFSGAANFKLGPSGPDAEGGIYVGLGRIVQMPELRIPLNGNAAQHEFGISGVTPEAARMIDADRATVRGARIVIADIELDNNLQPIGDPDWLWWATIATPRLVRTGSNPVTYTVSLIASTGNASRKQQQLSFFTGPQQRLRDPDDAACDGVAQLQDGTVPIWP